MKYINLIVDNNSKYTDTLYTYGTDLDLQVGDVVKVPYNKNNKIRNGYVFQVDVIPECPLEKIKKIESKDEYLGLSEEIIDTVCFMKRRYGIKYLDGIKCFIPPGKPAKEGKEKKPLDNLKQEKAVIPIMTQEQTNAVDIINEAVDDERHEIFLLHGVTSSGKTEVYMRVINEVISLGKTAILLVPEIALTKQIIERFAARFGKEKIAVLHSKLTKRERFDEWMRIKNGLAPIVIGARIGVFAPLENIGAIILDEEHESTYKSDKTPKYETIDIALKRLMTYKGVLILGSATPSVISYQRAREGIYTLIEMKDRYNKTPLPEVELVDMRLELLKGNKNIFSNALYNEITKTLAKKEQIILFLNRRGYSTFISCRECGYVLKCPECGISLTYHKAQSAGICHYCGKKFNIPELCPECNSRYLRYFGVGTEQVEEFTKKCFPHATVQRFDLDTALNKREINRILNDFAKGNTDILIGTQLVAKGLDFKNVGMVGVIAADVSLNIPDYRASERTFQLVTQVSGRAGRGEEKGRVIVQSYTPDNFALKTAANHDYKGFFEKEIFARKLMNYPPYTDMILVSFTSEDKKIAYAMAGRCKIYLERCIPDSVILEPKISYSFKGNQNYRFNIMIKAAKGTRNKYVYYLEAFGEKIYKEKEKCNMTIDVNPYSTF